MAPDHKLEKSEELKDLQRQLVSFASGQEKILSESLKNAIYPSGRLSTEEAIKVYGRSAQGGLFEALGETFEATWRVLGDEAFHSLCQDFISRFPSSVKNLKDYGREFPGHIATSSHHRDFPFLKDLALYEWCFKNLFHQKSHQAIPSSEFQKLQERPDAQLVLGESYSLFQSDYAVFDIWKLREQELEDLSDIPNWNEPSFLLLYKAGEQRDHSIHVKKLEKESFDFLINLEVGQSFEDCIHELEIKELGAEKSQQIIEELMQTLAWTGLVASIHIPS